MELKRWGGRQGQRGTAGRKPSRVSASASSFARTGYASAWDRSWRIAGQDSAGQCVRTRRPSGDIEPGWGRAAQHRGG